MKSKYVLNLILLASLASGCVSVTTSSDYVKGTNFSSMKTYDWVSASQPVSGDMRVDNTIVDSRIRNAVDNALALKGYEKATNGAPDFLVGYQAAINEKLDVNTIDVPYAFPGHGMGSFSGGTMHHGGSFYGSTFAYGGTETFVSQYEEGSVFIDVIDPKTKELVWRGTGKATVLEKAKPEKREARIKEGVKKILNDFPPTED